ncbi:MAG: sigma-70 family RNA polymerase sigma factor [Planctomycetota bacterium]
MTTRDRHLQGEMLQHAHMLRALARTLVRGADLDDLVQDTWLRGLEHPPARASSLAGWLSTILRRLFFEQRRARIRREQREKLVASTEVLPSTSDLVEHRATLRAVTEAVASLSDADYEVVRLRFYEGMKPARIAEHLELPLATVKRRLERAVVRLRRKLEDEHGRSWRLLLAPLTGWRAVPPQPSMDLLPVPASPVLAPTLIPLVSLGGLMAKKSLVVLTFLAVLVAGVSFFAFESPDSPVARHDPVAAAPREAAPAAATETLAVPLREAVHGAPTPSPSAVETGSVVAEISWSDGSPAAGVVATIFLGRLSELVVRTDGAGRARFEGLRPGRVFVRVYPYGHGRTEVISGEERTLEITIPVGLSVEGRVVARDGSPVPNAEIWIGFNPWEGILITTSDQNGSFRIRDTVEYVVAAFAAGHAPSPSYRLKGQQGETVTVTIEMGGAAGAICGQVSSSDGAAVASAIVAVAPDEARPVHRLGTESPPVRHVLTSIDGIFEMLGVAAGHVPVHVWAPGHAPWDGSVEVRPGETATLPVLLARQGELKGLVADSEGEPVAEARVGISWERENEWFFNYYRRVETQTGEDGYFRLESLPWAEVQGEASKPRVGTATATLLISDDTTWEPILDSGQTLRGRVVDEHGAGIPGCSVDAYQIGTGERGRRSSFSVSDRTDEEGRFVITNCPEPRCQLSVFKRELLDAQPLALLEEVVAGGPELTITVAARSRPSARITGTVLDASGKPVPVEVGLYTDAWSYRRVTPVDPKTGAFEFGPLPAASYQVEIKRLPLGKVDKIPIELEHGEHHDLGIIRLPPPGTLRVLLEGRDRISGNLAVSIGQPFPGATYHSLELEERDLSETLELLPGKYGIAVQGSGIVAQQENFEISPGDETVVTFPLRRGYVTRFSFALAPDDPEVQMISATVHNAENQHVSSVGANRGARGFVGEAVLAPGRYRIMANSIDPGGTTRVVTTDGREAYVSKPPRYTAELSFEVHEGGDGTVHAVELTRKQ